MIDIDYRITMYEVKLNFMILKSLIDVRNSKGQKRRTTAMWQAKATLF